MDKEDSIVVRTTHKDVSSGKESIISFRIMLDGDDEVIEPVDVSDDDYNSAAVGHIGVECLGIINLAFDGNEYCVRDISDKSAEPWFLMKIIGWYPDKIVYKDGMFHRFEEGKVYRARDDCHINVNQVEEAIEEFMSG